MADHFIQGLGGPPALLHNEATGGVSDLDDLNAHFPQRFHRSPLTVTTPQPLHPIDLLRHRQTPWDMSWNATGVA
jgi:hypothetical protein